MEFFLVDVKNIAPSKSYEQIDKTKVEKLADLILECDGLLKPLVLKHRGPENYIVIKGNTEYYAAVKAREKDPRKGEMVNAFVISPKSEEAIFKQLQALESPVKSVEKPSVEILHSLKNEVKNIACKIEILSSLPSQLTGIMKQMEKGFQSFVNERMTQLEDKFVELIKKPEIPVDIEKKPKDYNSMNVKQLKALVKDRKIKGYSKMKKAELIDVLEKNDMT